MIRKVASFFVPPLLPPAKTELAKVKETASAKTNPRNMMLFLFAKLETKAVHRNQKHDREIESYTRHGVASAILQRPVHRLSGRNETGR
jgi:hypothetical protein